MTTTGWVPDGALADLVAAEAARQGMTVARWIEYAVRSELQRQLTRREAEARIERRSA